MAAGDLTTLAAVKSYLHITDIASDTLLAALITGVSARIQKDCQRNFTAQDYLETSNTQVGQTRAQVRNKPLNKVYGVRWGYAMAIQVKYTGAAASATCSVNANRTIDLSTIDSAGRHTNSIDLTNVSYSLASQVVTQINAFSGWTATLLGGIDIPTQWFCLNVNLNCKSGGNQFTQAIGYYPVDVFTYLIDPTYGTIGFQPLTTADYFFQNDAQVAFPGMYQGLLIQYNGGYATIPSDIDLLCQQIVAEVYNLSLKDPNLQQETLGDYTYQLVDPMLRRQIYADVLAPYRRVALAGGIG